MSLIKNVYRNLRAAMHRVSGTSQRLRELRLTRREVDRLYFRKWAGDREFLEAFALYKQGDLQSAFELANASKSDEVPGTWQNFIVGLIGSEVLPKLRQTLSRRRVLLVKDWSCGFWAEIDHLIGQLFLAEISNRTPVVNWGKSSLYNPGNIENCFPLFFEPLNDLTVENLTDGEDTYFPGIFNPLNLKEQQADQFSRQGSLDRGISVLVRDETVLVSDRHVAIEILWEFWKKYRIDETRTLSELVRDLFFRYLRPRKSISDLADEFFKTIPNREQVCAVHVRGGDRMASPAQLQRDLSLYFAELGMFLEQFPEGTIFLLTDSNYVVERFNERYASIVFTTPSHRTSGAAGVHYQESVDRYQIGREALVDVLIAIKCSRFIGCMSNVSRYVNFLADWGDRAVLLRDVPST